MTCMIVISDNVLMTSPRQSGPADSLQLPLCHLPVETGTTAVVSTPLPALSPRPHSVSGINNIDITAAQTPVTRGDQADIDTTFPSFL